MLFILHERLRTLAVTLLLLAGGCQSAPPPQSFPGLAFTQRGVIALDLARVEIVSLYRPPLKAPNVDHQFPVPPEAAARRWAEDRIRPVGARDRVVFTIRDASAVEVPLPRTAGLRGVVTDDQSERYDASLAVDLVIWSGEVRVATVEAQAVQSRTVPESTSVNGRRQVWFEMTEALMRDLDARLDQEVRRAFARWLTG